MAVAPKGSIAALLVSSFCERINYVTAMTITVDNSLLGTAELNMFAMLRMDKECLKFMKTRYRKELTGCIFGKYDVCLDTTFTFKDNISL